MIREALGTPLTGERWWKRLLIGGGLLVISFGIVPLWVVMGYLVRSVETVTEGREEISPSFEYWGLLMSSGVRAFAIAVVYLSIPVAVMLWGLFLRQIAPYNDSVTLSQAEPPLTAAAVLFTIAFYLLPAALLAYSVDGRVRAGFSPRLLSRFWFSLSYLRSWLVCVVLVVVLHLCAIAVALTAIGVLVVPAVIFYSYLVGTHVLSAGTSGLLADINTNTQPGRRT